MDANGASYRVVLTCTGEGENKRFLARAPELSECEAEGATRAEAIANLEEELDAQISNIAEAGGALPQPVDSQTFDGQLSFEVTPDIHRELVFWAKERNMELGAALAALVTRGLLAPPPKTRPQRNPQEGGGEHRQRRRGGGGQPNYHNIMDNRADFIEYVRQSERNERSRGRSGGSRGRGRGRSGGGAGGGQ